MFEVLKSRYSTWKRYSRTVQELESLTSRELSMKEEYDAIQDMLRKDVSPPTEMKPLPK